MTELTGMTCEELTAWAKENGYPAFRENRSSDGFIRERTFRK